MGQPIEAGATVLDDVAVLGTDRTLTGQEGVGFGSAQEAAAGEGLAATTAATLFACDPALERVFVASNQVLMRRRGGWDAPAVESAAGAVRGLFVFYKA